MFFTLIHSQDLYLERQWRLGGKKITQLTLECHSTNLASDNFFTILREKQITYEPLKNKIGVNKNALL